MGCLVVLWSIHKKREARLVWMYPKVFQNVYALQQNNVESHVKYTVYSTV